MNPAPEPRIRSSHTQRAAVVYIRQSTQEQVRNNKESTRIQLSLRDKAIGLGWPQPVVIDDDLGVSAGGYATRPGFQRLLSEIAAKKVGIVLCIDASRLSRNSRDWAHLFELCGFFETLVADPEQVYDLSIPNDRLLLGIKGTVAEMELSILRTRLKMGSEAKAERGELKFLVPPGYSHDSDGRIVLDPNSRIQEAIRNLFLLFNRCSSLRQLSLYYRDSKLLFPIQRVRDGGRAIVWEIPSYSALRKLLRHPIYAGIYTYGRRQQRVEYMDGKLVKRSSVPAAPEQARICIYDNHEAYISREQFAANQSKLDEARPRWNMRQNHGAVREGLALLTGILRCGHCGRLLHVAYKADSAMYFCNGNGPSSARRCLSFGSHTIDKTVALQLCRAVEPLALQAANEAFEIEVSERRQFAEQARMSVQAAQYEVDRAFEQYDLVDPRNRLVADTLEARLNDRLVELQSAKNRLDGCMAECQPLTDDQRARINALARDIPAAWNHPDAPPTIKKRLLRAAIHEVIVLSLPDVAQLEVTIHWQGGCHTRFHVNKRRRPKGSKADPDLVELVRALAQDLGDPEMTRILNMKRITTPRGLPWTMDRVVAFRRHHSITLGSRKPDPDLLTGAQAADYLGVSRNGLVGLIRNGYIEKRQVTEFAPWGIHRADLDSDRVRVAVATLKKTGRVPAPGGCPDDQASLFPVTTNTEQ